MVNHTNEAELILRLRQDDVSAFDILYYTYHNSLYSNIFRLTRQADISKDILQEVFVSLWEKRSSLDPQQPVGGWLFVVSYNKSVTHLRKRLKESLLKNNDVGIETDPEKEVQREDQLSMLEEAIKKLSPQKRRVFELCKIQGKTYEETASELGISKHTVKEYLSGAVSTIKNYIQQHPGHQSVFVNAVITVFLCSA